jgi:MFS family permease
MLPRGPLLLGTLLVLGAGALGLFPNFYAFTQEISTRHQGKVTGLLGAITWIVTSIIQKYVGRIVDQTHSYAIPIAVAGIIPLVGAACLLLFWVPRRTVPPTGSTK